MAQTEGIGPISSRTHGKQAKVLLTLGALALAILSSACVRATNTRSVNLPLASSDVEEISSVAEDRSGVIRWRGADAPEVRAEIGTITRDSLSYAELEGTQLLWASLAEVSRVEFPYSRTRNVLVGSVSGALGGALGFLATTGYFALLLCDDDCDLQWISGSRQATVIP